MEKKAGVAVWGPHPGAPSKSFPPLPPCRHPHCHQGEKGLKEIRTEFATLICYRYCIGTGWYSISRQSSWARHLFQTHFRWHAIDQSGEFKMAIQDRLIKTRTHQHSVPLLYAGELWDRNWVIIIIEPIALTLANWCVMAMIRPSWLVMDSSNEVVLQIIFCYVEATHRKLNRRFNTSTILFLATEYNAQDGGTRSNGSDFLR